MSTVQHLTDRAPAVGVSVLGKGANNAVVVFDATTGGRLFELPTRRKTVTTLAFSADGTHLAVGSTGPSRWGRCRAASSRAHWKGRRRGRRGHTRGRDAGRPGNRTPASLHSYPGGVPGKPKGK